MSEFYDNVTLNTRRKFCLQEDTFRDAKDYTRRIRHWLDQVTLYGDGENWRASLERARIAAQDLLGLLDEILDDDPCADAEARLTQPGASDPR